MDGELLSLKWNNHRTTFYHIISGLRNKESYTDVTLACDGKFYPTHKFVLSTCSQYFQEIFDRTPCKNPVVVLKDIQCRDLEFLLDYMYIGEVNVRQNELTSLIKAAECLRVKGLAVPDEEPKKSASSSSVSNSERHRPEQSSPPAKRRRAEERRIAPIVTDQSPGRPPGDRLGSPDRRDTQSSKADGSACDEGQGDRSDLIVIKEEKEDTQDDVVNVQNSYDGGDDDGDGPHDSEGNTNEFPEFLQSTIEKEEPVAISEFNPDFPGPSGLQNSGLNPWEGENSTTSFPEGLSGAVAAAVAAAAQPQQRQQQLGFPLQNRDQSRVFLWKGTSGLPVPCFCTGISVDGDVLNVVGEAVQGKCSLTSVLDVYSSPFHFETWADYSNEVYWHLQIIILDIF
ncbi:protein tramtrack, beta isoform-like isoform X19 [Macrobrachium rosenbergii]|uniref:protein tramtrack, beta isoform-like isoform X19 n=1 Tax=Macrobrachium rosenbergii TaxID=79674 RepID=UPI0034D62143